MVKIEFTKTGNYCATIDFFNLNDLHIFINDISEFLGKESTKNDNILLDNPSVKVKTTPKIVIEDIDDDIISSSSENITEYSEDDEKCPTIEPIDYKSNEICVLETTIEDKSNEICVLEPKIVVNKKFNYKELLEQTDIKPGSYKNYPFKKDKIWCLLDNPKKILKYLQEQSNNTDGNSSKIQKLYRLFTLFFKLNDIHKYISNNDDLTTLNNLFTPIKAQKNLVSKKKTLSNVQK